MDEHDKADKETRRNRLMLGATITAIILIVAANITLMLLHPSEATNTIPALDQARTGETTEPSAGTTDEASKPTATDVCADAAPKATKAYVTDSTDRDKQLDRYFAKDAAGLNIPISRIALQPDVEFAGGLNTGDDATATCSVHTGLESPWTLTYQWTPETGWKCTGIQGPIDGAYKLQGDKPQQSGEEQ
ncbi:MAG: hypothetical protein ACLR82_02190 [Bifidobacterium longum]